MSTTDAPSLKAGGKRARTRAALIAATLEVVADKGFAAASLDEIAARAGMTKGAIYSNFAGKAQLLMAAMGSKGLFLADLPPSDAPLKQQIRTAAGALAAAIDRAKGEANFVAEFQLYAFSDPDLRREVAAGYARIFADIADRIAATPGAAPSMPARDLAVALQSIALGFMFQSFVTPEAVTTEIIEATLGALAEGLERKSAG